MKVYLWRVSDNWGVTTVCSTLEKAKEQLSKAVLPAVGEFWSVVDGPFY